MGERWKIASLKRASYSKILGEQNDQKPLKVVILCRFLCAHVYVPERVSLFNTGDIVASYSDLALNEWGWVKGKLISTYDLYTIFRVPRRSPDIGMGDSKPSPKCPSSLHRNFHLRVCAPSYKSCNPFA